MLNNMNTNNINNNTWLPYSQTLTLFRKHLNFLFTARQIYMQRAYMQTHTAIYMWCMCVHLSLSVGVTSRSSIEINKWIKMYAYPTLCFREIRTFQKIKVLPSGIVCQTLNVTDFSAFFRPPWHCTSTIEVFSTFSSEVIKS